MNQNFDLSRSQGESLPVPLCDTAVMMDVTKDYTLPDYQPEVRRIVYVDVTPLPPAKYVTERGAELNGNVDYTVLYVGMDGELYSVPLSAEYGASVAFQPPEDAESGGDVRLLCDVCCDTVTTRLIAPRRLTVKSRLRGRVLAYGALAAFDPAGGQQSESLRLLERKARAVVACEGSGPLLDLDYSRPLPAEQARLVTAEASAVCTESHCAEGRIAFRGNAEGRLLFALEEENGTRYETRLFSLPFEGEGEYDGPQGEEQEIGRVTCKISELSADAAEGELQCRMSISTGLQVLTPVSVPCVEDLYALDRECSCDCRAVSYLAAASCFTEHFSQSERTPLSALNFTEQTELLAVFGRAAVHELSPRDTGCSLSGQCHYTVIGRTDGEISASELMLPFRWEREETGANSFLCAVELLSPSVRTDGDQLVLESEVYLTGALMRNGTVPSVRGVEFGDPLPKRECGLVVCYPAPGEGLWSVAKRYAVDPASVSGDPERERYVIIRT